MAGCGGSAVGTEKGDMEGIIPSVPSARSETGTQVEVKFLKKPYQTQKYLEAEPKALGVTQIVLGLFVISFLFSDPSISDLETRIINSISSSASIIAGSVAIAAQNLHLPTLKACMGVQIVVCVSSAIGFLNNLLAMADFTNSDACWEEQMNDTFSKDMCNRLWSIYEHIIGIEMLVQATQIALSATLAAFCCKVIQCCSPRSNVPVIVVNAPPQ